MKISKITDYAALIFYWQIEMFKRGKTMDMILVKYIFQNRFTLISVTYVGGTHWNCLIEAIQ